VLNAMFDEELLNPDDLTGEVQYLTKIIEKERNSDGCLSRSVTSKFCDKLISTIKKYASLG
jgi:hypothetical protein